MFFLAIQTVSSLTNPKSRISLGGVIITGSPEEMSALRKAASTSKPPNVQVLVDAANETKVLTISGGMLDDDQGSPLLSAPDSKFPHAHIRLFSANPSSLTKFASSLGLSVATTFEGISRGNRPSAGMPKRSRSRPRGVSSRTSFILPYSLISEFFHCSCRSPL